VLCILTKLKEKMHGNTAKYSIVETTCVYPDGQFMQSKAVAVMDMETGNNVIMPLHLQFSRLNKTKRATGYSIAINCKANEVHPSFDSIPQHLMMESMKHSMTPMRFVVNKGETVAGNCMGLLQSFKNPLQHRSGEDFLPSHDRWVKVESQVPDLPTRSFSEENSPDSASSSDFRYDFELLALID